MILAAALKARTTADRLAQALGATQSGAGWMAHCPAHQDAKASLSISTGNNGKPLVHCHAGCSQADVIDALKKRGLWASNGHHETSTNGRKIVATYDYHDEQGTLLYQTVRYKPKDFRQRCPDGEGWKWSLNGIRRVLYRLSEVLQAERVFVVEGEKDADTLVDLGLTATTSPMGAGKWRDEYAPFLAGKRVIVIADNDEPGKRHADQVAQSVLPVAKSVRVVHLPAGSKDVTEWVDGGGTKAELFKLVNSAPKLSKQTAAAVPNGLQDIKVSDRELRDISADCLKALQTANDPPRLFVRAGLLAHVVRDEAGRPSIRTASEAYLRGSLSRAANFQRTAKEGAKAVSPPLDAVRDILSRPQEEWGFPALVGVVEAPVIRGDGSLLIAPGYDPTLRVVYAPAPTLVVPKIPDRPRQKACVDAVKVVDDAIAEFPFADAASRANAIAMLLTPVIRRAIGGMVPIGLIDAPQAGSGKSLLAEVAAIIHTGSPAALRPAPGGRDDEEWRKSIAALLLGGHPLTVFDNVEKTLESASLALAVTASTFATRILGRTEDLILPQETVFLVTGNNIVLGGDLPRRCFWIRLDAQSSRPWQGRRFKHPNLKRYLMKKRGEVLAALLTMVRGWYAAGKPVAKVPVLGSFEAWCRTIGGILAHAGVEGFLGNLEDLYSQADPSEAQWEAFLRRLHRDYRGWFTISQVLEDAALSEEFRAILPDELAEADPKRSLNPRKIGWGFRKKQGRRYGAQGLHLVKGSSASGIAQWAVCSKEGKKR